MRTAAMQAVRRAVLRAGAPAAARALSRRAFLAIAAAAAACSPQARHGSIAAGAKRGVAIVGGGAAGLTVGYRLGQADISATLYEASKRWGGRMFTRRDFNEDGQFCELGGELVDTNHQALRSLAQELGVGIDAMAPAGDEGEDIFHIRGKLYCTSDLMDARGRGAFRPAALRIAEDQAALLTEDDDWTERARALDATSLRAYLDALRTQVSDWVIDILDLAYWGEYGLPTSEQSALNLVDMIGAETTTGFRIFGDSDEAFRIHGGSSTLIEALQTRLAASVTQKLEHVLTAIAPIADGVKLTFATPGGVIETEHDAAALCLPYSVLRGVDGVGALGLDEAKLRAIRELGYGDNAKIMVSTLSRPWLDPAREFPAKSNGTFYSDTGMQVVWETSRGQVGERGVLTNYVAGVADEQQFTKLARGLQSIAPTIAQSLDLSKRAVMFWARQPFARGSFASAKVGQYTTLLEHVATPALDGRIQFAGEHTSADFLGYMNGAVESGERVAKALLS
jgi:monoamine oxidase